MVICSARLFKKTIDLLSSFYSFFTSSSSFPRAPLLENSSANSWMRSTPRLKTSELIWAFPSSSSGAEKVVMGKEDGWLRGSHDLSLGNSIACPKFMILREPSWRMMMFWGLIARWRMGRVWRARRRDTMRRRWDSSIYLFTYFLLVRGRVYLPKTAPLCYRRSGRGYFLSSAFYGIGMHFHGWFSWARRLSAQWFTLFSEVAGECLLAFIVEGDAFEGEPFLENGVESGEALN